MNTDKINSNIRVELQKLNDTINRLQNRIALSWRKIENARAKPDQFMNLSVSDVQRYSFVVMSELRRMQTIVVSLLSTHEKLSKIALSLSKYESDNKDS